MHAVPVRPRAVGGLPARFRDEEVVGARCALPPSISLVVVDARDHRTVCAEREAPFSAR